MSRGVGEGMAPNACKLGAKNPFLTSEACWMPAVRTCFSECISKTRLVMTIARAFKTSAVRLRLADAPEAIREGTVTVSFPQRTAPSRDGPCPSVERGCGMECQID